MREKTYAHRFLEDDVPVAVKNQRIVAVNEKLREMQARKYKLELGRWS